MSEHIRKGVLMGEGIWKGLVNELFCYYTAKKPTSIPLYSVLLQLLLNWPTYQTLRENELARSSILINTFS